MMNFLKSLRYRFAWWLVGPVVEADLRNIDSNLRAIFHPKTGVVWKDEVTVGKSGELKSKELSLDKSNE